MARFLADLEGKTVAEYKIHTLAGTIIPVVRTGNRLRRSVVERDVFCAGTLFVAMERRGYAFGFFFLRTFVPVESKRWIVLS